MIILLEVEEIGPQLATTNSVWKADFAFLSAGILMQGRVVMFRVISRGQLGTPGQRSDILLSHRAESCSARRVARLTSASAREGAREKRLSQTAWVRPWFDF